MVLPVRCLAGSAGVAGLGGEGAAAACGFFLCGRFELGELGGLLFGDDLLAFGCSVEGRDFTGFQLAKLAGGDVEAEGSVADAADLFDVVADLFEHFADLAIAAFGEGELVPGIVAATNEFDFGGRGDDAIATAAADFVEAAAIDHDAVADLVEAYGGWGSADFD